MAPGCFSARRSPKTAIRCAQVSARRVSRQAQQLHLIDEKAKFAHPAKYCSPFESSVRHDVIDELEASLAGIVPEERVELSGSWSQSRRRTYASSSQLGSGSGPFVDGLDLTWDGTLACAAPLAGVAFLLHPEGGCWARSERATLNPSLRVFLLATAYDDGRALLGMLFHGAYLPIHSVPVSGGWNPIEALALGPMTLTTGRMHVIAAAEGMTFAVILLQGSLLKSGRCGNWRLREKHASTLPARPRELLTRRRKGWFPASRVE